MHSHSPLKCQLWIVVGLASQNQKEQTGKNSHCRQQNSSYPCFWLPGTSSLLNTRTTLILYFCKKHSSLISRNASTTLLLTSNDYNDFNHNMTKLRFILISFFALSGLFSAYADESRATVSWEEVRRERNSPPTLMEPPQCNYTEVFIIFKLNLIHFSVHWCRI